MKTERILLIDMDDQRRATRVAVLQGAGYSVRVRQDFIAAEELADEGESDLVILSIRIEHKLALAYAVRLRGLKPDLPILLLTDQGAYVAASDQRSTLEAGSPIALLEKVAKMLAGSVHVRELPREV